MNQTIPEFLIVIVPLVAGLILLAVCARTIFVNPNIGNSIVAVLGVGALLCIAPTILNLAIKLPGGGEITLVREQVQDQAQQVKNDLGVLGAQLKGQIDALSKRVDALQKNANLPSTSAVNSQYLGNKNKVVIIYYNIDRKDLALEMEAYLLQKGYSANAVYTDFKELPDLSQLPAGSISILTMQNAADQALKVQIESELRAKFPDFKKITDSVSPKIAAGGVQIRLF